MRACSGSRKSSFAQLLDDGRQARARKRRRRGGARPDGRRQGAGRRPLLQGQARSTARSRRCASRARPSSRSSISRRSKAAIRRTPSPMTGRPTSPAGRPENYTHSYKGEVTLALRHGAFAQHGGGQAHRRGRSLARGAHGAAARHPFQAACPALDRARHRRSHAARARRRLCALRQWRPGRAAPYHHPRAQRRRQGALPAPALDHRPGGGAALCRRHERHDERHGDARHRQERGDRGSHGRRQDRHDAELPRCLVRRLHRPLCRRRVDRQRQQLAHAEGHRRHAAGRAVARHHALCASRTSRRCRCRARARRGRSRCRRRAAAVANGKQAERSDDQPLYQRVFGSFGGG